MDVRNAYRWQPHLETHLRVLGEPGESVCPPGVFSRDRSINQSKNVLARVFKARAYTYDLEYGIQVGI